MARLFDDAASDYLELGSTPVTAVPLTLAAWFNKNDTTISTQVLVIGNNAVTVERFGLGYSSGEDVQAAAQSLLATNQVSSTGTGSINAWTHGVGVFNAIDSVTVYRDGGNSATGTTSVTPLTLNAVNIGCRYGATSRTGFFSGSIAEAAIWNAALTAGEVNALATGRKPNEVRPQNLVFYCPLIQNLTNFKGTAPTATGTIVSAHPRICWNNYRIFRGGPITVSAVTNALSSSLDAILQKQGVLKTAALDALIQKAITSSALLDAYLQKQGILRTTSLDAILVKTATALANLDALLLKSGVLLTVKVDALIQKQGLTLSASLDALVQKQAIPLTASIDALLVKVSTATAQLDAYLQKQGITVSSSLDAVLVKTVTAAINLDAVLMKEGILISGLLDAVIVPFWSTSSGSSGLWVQSSGESGTWTLQSGKSGAWSRDSAQSNSWTVQSPASTVWSN